MSGPFRCMIADPPWKYGGTDQFQPAGEDTFRAVRMRYPTMRTEAICALDVAALAAEDCVLLLWATLPLLPDALAVLAAWGFTYKTAMPWIKLAGDPQRDLWGAWHCTPQYGTGFWVRACAELVLIGRRGNPKPPPEAASSVGLLSANFGHSRKPENLYQYAEYFPGPYLELFGRRSRPGWTTLGDGLSGRDIADAIHEIATIGAAGATAGAATDVGVRQWG